MGHQISRILVVDDEINFLKSLERHLKREGYFVVTASNGVSARGLIEKHLASETPFDLVVTDVVMPKMNGIDLLRFIKANCPQTPVVMLSGFGDMDMVIDNLRAGIDLSAQKPITPMLMNALIKRIAEQSKSHRKAYSFYRIGE